MQLPKTPPASPAPLSVAPPIVLPSESVWVDPLAKTMEAAPVEKRYANWLRRDFWLGKQGLIGKANLIGKREGVIVLLACVFLAFAPSAAQMAAREDEPAVLTTAYRDNAMGGAELPERNFPGSALYFVDTEESASYAALGIEADALAAMGVDGLPAGYPAGVDGQAAGIDPAELASEGASLTPPLVLPGVGAVARPFRMNPVGMDYERALKCLTDAIYYEAASEPDAGQRAVAQVIVNRMRHPSYPDTICGVIYQGSERATGCQFSYSCDGAMRRVPSTFFYNRARRVAAAALSGSVFAPVGLATHYHTTEIYPYWAPSLRFIGVVGAHRFYTFKGSAGSSNAFFRRYAGAEPFPGPKARAYSPTPTKSVDPVQLQAQYERDYAAAQAQAEADAKAAESRRMGSVPMPTYAAPNPNSGSGGPAPQITGSDPYATPVQSAPSNAGARRNAPVQSHAARGDTNVDPQSGSVKAEFQQSGSWKQ